MSINSLIRNFSIIAHIDHGKSTIADRFIQMCGGLSDREMEQQVLDSMDIERERGITIKAQSVTLDFHSKDGKTYQLNFIDTPGHVDFSYEVSRSLEACEGALLVVDAAQGVEAQSVANCYTALELGLEVVPVLNKMDLPQADPDKVKQEIEEVIGIDASDAVAASAKSGLGMEAVLEQLIELIPPPTGDEDKPLQALIIDSWFDNYLGIVSLVRIKNGVLRKKDKIVVKSTGIQYGVDDIGIFTPKRLQTDVLRAGEVGYVVAGIKDIHGAPVGDTLTHLKTADVESLPGFKKVQPQVYAGLFPTSSDDYEDFREALSKLSLNDASLFYEPESSDALGFGFRCGFLGMLHMEIIQERLEREFNMTVITTVPNVSYHAYTKKNPTEIVLLNNPTDLPDPSRLDKVEEPYIKASIITKSSFVGQVMSLCIEKRGEITNQTYLTTERVELTFDMPLAEIVFDFYDRLKTVSKGYASFDYSPIGMRESKLVRVDILLNGSPVDALSALLHADNAYSIGKKIVEKLKELIPRQQFDIPIQAAIGAKIIARETTKALRKDVTAKCYGGDISRKRKLLEKQKKGKKRMRQVGNVEIPQEAFMAVLKLND